MTSLSTVLKNFQTIETHPLVNDAKEEISSFLEECPTPDRYVDWHQTKLHWLKHRAACKALELLCANVAILLFLASAKILDLRIALEAEDHDLASSSEAFKEAMMIIRVAFSQFELVHQIPSSEARHKKQVLCQYLRQVFEVAIVLANVSSADEGECFSAFWSEGLDSTDLMGFQFDAYEMGGLLKDRSLAGVLLPADKIPKTCLPAYPTSPIVYLNDRQYGPPVIRNAFYDAGYPR